MAFHASTRVTGSTVATPLNNTTSTVFTGSGIIYGWFAEGSGSNPEFQLEDSDGNIIMEAIKVLASMPISSNVKFYASNGLVVRNGTATDLLFAIFWRPDA